MNDQNNYDAIIIGAGIGGLNCACILALGGYKILILEKNNFIGGRCSSFEKDGFIIDYGVHAFVNGKDGPLYVPIRKAKKPNLIKKDNIIWKRINFQFHYNGKYIQTFFPINFFQFWNIVKNIWYLITLKVPFADKKEFLKMTLKIYTSSKKKIAALKSVTVKEYLEKNTISQLVKSVLIKASDCYAVFSHDKVSAMDYVEPSKKAFHSKGVSYPMGGCGAISKAYEEILKKAGGEILTNSEVERVIMEDNKVVGVRIKRSSQEFRSNVVVLNINWKDSFGSIIPKDKFPEVLGKGIENLETSRSAVVAHIALNKPLIKKKFIMRASDVLNDEAHKIRENGQKVEEQGGFIPIVSNIDPNLAPPDKQLVCLGIDGHYGFDYNKDDFKYLALKFVQQLAGEKHKVQDHLLWIHILLPKDLETLFGEKGSIIGLAQKIGQVRDDRLDSKTPIKGLYHCGDDSGKYLFGVGTELAAESGQKCAEIILSELNA